MQGSKIGFEKKGKAPGGRRGKFDINDPSCYSIRVHGVPCYAKVVSYYEGFPGIYRGKPEDREPEEPASVEFIIIDRKGYPAPWLEDKLNNDEREELANLIISKIKNGDDGYYD